MKICVLSHGYPTSKTASSVFVAKLCDEFADQGHEVTIIAPQSISNILLRDGAFSSIVFKHKTAKGNIVYVYRPYTMSFGTGKVCSIMNFYLKKRSIKKVISKIDEQDVFYAHFWSTGYLLYSVIKKLGKPMFVATGESIISFRTDDSEFKHYVRGVISVSSKNVNESVNAGLTTIEKCIVLPNAIDSNEFYKMDREQCRKQLGIKDDEFVVGQVGTVCHRKGSMRISAAIDKCHDEKIRSFFLGRTSTEIPNCKGIIKLGFVNHVDVPIYLNAADVYCLPSLAEGCSNSIVEAMACGLPIISSNLPFNEDILDEGNAILVDPNSVEQISDAILKLKQDPQLRELMSENSLKKANVLTLENRAKKIITFIKERM